MGFPMIVPFSKGFSSGSPSFLAPPSAGPRAGTLRNLRPPAAVEAILHQKP